MTDTANPASLPGAADLAALRQEVREFLHQEEAAGTFVPASDPQVGGFNAEFSRMVARRGWIGMTWPQEYGGGGRDPIERYIVCEELVAGGAPVGAHWSADRQIGPGLLSYGSEQQRRQYLPRIAKGECFFCLGISEPEAGSDLAAVRTSARPHGSGWLINGRKIWTSHAHAATYIVVLARTDPNAERHDGLSQFIVPLSTAGVYVRPLKTLTGKTTFSEVTFDDVYVEADTLFGAAGEGWRQINAELAHERSGPERFLSAFQLVLQLVRLVEGEPHSDMVDFALGRIAAHLMALRQMSITVAMDLNNSVTPPGASVIVKDLGTVLEGEIVEICRQVAPAGRGPERRRFDELLLHARLASPSFTLRGGTTEILRGIIARNLGVR